MPYEDERVVSRPVKIFLSYTREDEPLVRRLTTHLSMLRRETGVEVLVSREKIAAGDSWAAESGKALEAADLILFFVSPAFLASPHCAREVERTLARQEAGGGLIIPIILRPCDWQYTPLGRVQGLPRDGRAVTEWDHQDKAFAVISMDIRRVVEQLQGKGGARAGGVTPARSIEFVVEEGDVTTFDADVVALKYAQEFHGADEAVSRALGQAGVPDAGLRPKEGESVYLATRGGIRSPHVLFVGTPGLFEFEYQDIRRFAARALEALARENPATGHVVMTIHGVGYGLDETEAAYAQFAGIWDSVSAGKAPAALRKISLIDVNAARVERLRKLFDSAFKLAFYASRAEGPRWAYRLDPELKQEDAAGGHLRAISVAEPPARDMEKAGMRAQETPYVFVAMPFAEEMEDVFYYGIQKSAHAVGYLCERIDQESFTGDILERLKAKIAGSSVVVADLTGDNPNVFLEVGYAWGKSRPTVLVLKESKQQLRFDVQGQRCIKYKSIRNLEEALTKMLRDLKADGSV